MGVSTVPRINVVTLLQNAGSGVEVKLYGLIHFCPQLGQAVCTEPREFSA